MDDSELEPTLLLDSKNKRDESKDSFLKFTDKKNLYPKDGE